MSESNDERSADTLEGMAAAWQQTTDALHDSERRYRELVEYSLGLICTHDLTGIILSINPAARGASRKTIFTRCTIRLCSASLTSPKCRCGW